jgi:beta-glucan synthesis-associated protein KRE6
VGRSKAESYQCDAVGAMGNLNASFFEEMHTYRLEWEPGDEGYLRWYIDGEFRFGIEQEGLDKMGTVIPKEPSYLILNTAISTSWGFPATPAGCEDFDCKTTAGQCGFAPGFCRTLPAVFKIDSVRLYQNKKNPNHLLGCNPKEYPTRKFIHANRGKYVRPLKDKAPLKKVVRGKGSCKENKECGEGVCTKSRECQCSHGWTGPHCLVSTVLLFCLQSIATCIGGLVLCTTPKHTFDKLYSSFPPVLISISFRCQLIRAPSLIGTRRFSGLI